jgi:transposase
MTVTDAITPLLTARIPYLKLERLDRHDNQLHAIITSQQLTSNCPACGTPNAILHSHYNHTVQDIPVGGSNATWTLHVRRFRCRKRSCQRRVFCERFDQKLNAYARSTSRVKLLFEKTSLAIGASAVHPLLLGSRQCVGGSVACVWSEVVRMRRRLLEGCGLHVAGWWNLIRCV